MAGPHHPIVVKTGTSPAGRLVVAREAARLDRARHPGVVELLAVDDEHLELAWAGTHTLDTFHPPLPEAAAILAAVAGTVADLHGLGIIHGRLDPAHVVIGGDGRPRLCGLRGPQPGEAEPSPADDVAGIGRLIDHLVGPGAEPEPIPERRWGKRTWSGYHRRSLQTLADHATDEDPARRPTARAIAAAIVESVPEARFAALPTASPEPVATPAPDDEIDTTDTTDTTELIDEIDEIDHPLPGPARHGEDPWALAAETDAWRTDEASDPHPPVDGDPDDRFLGLRIEPGAPHLEAPPGPARRPSMHRVEPRAPQRGPATRRRRAGAVVALVVLAVMALTGWLRPVGSQPRAGAPTIEAAPPTAARPAAASVERRPRTSVPASCPRPRTADPGPSMVDIDGDGCPDEVTIVDTQVVAAGITYRVGSPGDRVAVGDWDCDGTATPGLVRPSTGELFLFNSWAPSGEPVTRSATAALAGATELIAPDPTAGCARPLVRLTSGRVVPVTVHAAGRAHEAGR